MMADWRARLLQLPRDTRDTLFQLLVIAWTITPHLLHLPPWCGVMSVALLAWRARLALTAAPLPSRWLISALLIAASALTFWGQNTLLGKEAGITLLVVLMSLKTLELRARRDALVVFFLGFFLVLTHFLYSQSLLTGLWLLLAVWGLLTAQVLAHMPVGRPTLRRAASLSARAAGLGLPVMLVLFVLFPRVGPLWGLPQDAQGRTGLSGTMRLGGVASLAEDEAIALRVRFLGPPPAPEQLYFRGPVLSSFDGRDWTRLVPTFPVAERARLELKTSGAPVRYEVTVEPSQLSILPLLEMTPDNAASAPSIAGWLLTLRPDGQWQTDRPIAERQRLVVSSWMQHQHGPLQAVPGLRDLVDLPPNSNPRTLQWAADLRRQPLLANADARQLSAAVLQHIRNAGFTYTMEPGPYSGNSIDEFWLDRKLGFCEHFASAYVVIMRAMDVPARVVTGYQGADPDPQDGYWIVRQRNAHAWAEIWQAGIGWMRVDPTAAVAPDRVQRGRSLRAPPGLVAGAINSINPAVAEQLRRAWETANNRWNQWVLNYSRGQQFDLLRELGFNTPSWQDLTTTLILLLCAAALAGAAWAWWDRRRQDPWQRLQQRVAQQLLQLGVHVQPHHPPRERAAQVRQQWGQAGEPLAQQLDELDRQRYGATAGSGPLTLWWRTFKGLAKAAAKSR
jgi:transglutaminase-like putative cysteine protease